MRTALHALQACLNPRVLVALALIGAALVILVPGIATLAIPLLILAACPLSMLVMMHMMRGPSAGPSESATLKGSAELRAELAFINARRQLLEKELEALPREGEVPRDGAGSYIATAG